MEHLPAISVVVNFVVLMVILVYYTRKPVRDMLGEKHNSWKQNIEEAEALRVQTQSLFDDYQGKLAKLDQDIEKIMADAKAKGEQYKTQMQERAEKNAAKIIAEAHMLAAQEVKKVRAQLQNEALTKALASAEATLKDKVTQEDQDFFVEGFIQEMEMSRRG